MSCKRPGGCGFQLYVYPPLSPDQYCNLTHGYLSCWECLAPWLPIISTDNSKHYDNCKYYSGRPGKNPAPPEVVAARTVRAPPAPSTSPLLASPLVTNPARSTPRSLRELLLPHAAQKQESVKQPVRSGGKNIEKPIQELFPPTTPDASPAGPSTDSGSSRPSIQEEYGRPNQGSLLSVPPEGPTSAPRGAVAGPSTNQRPPAATPPTLGDLYDLHRTSAFTGNFGEDETTQRRRKNAEAQKQYRERKKAYEAGLESKGVSSYLMHV
jgi:hypothetical protein